MFYKFICKLIHEFEMCFLMGIKVNVLARLVHKSLFNLEVAGNILKTRIFHEIMGVGRKHYSNMRRQHNSVRYTP